MTGIIYLDIAIGIIFMLLVFSLFASAIQEAIAGIFGWRGKALAAGLKRLLQAEFDEFWTNPLIEPLQGPSLTFNDKEGGRRKPSYIPPEIFAKAILTQFGLAGKAPSDLLTTIRNDPKLRDSPMGKRIQAVVTGVEGGVAEAEQAIANWYDTTMERVSGWYTRRAQFILFVIGLFMAVSTNTDMIAYAVELREDDSLRQSLVQKAEEYAALDDLDDVRARLGIPGLSADEAETAREVTGEIRKRLASLTAELDQTGVRAGWEHCASEDTWIECLMDTINPWGDSYPDIPNPLLGWLLLASGVMLGAQFWFDVLKRFVSIRSAVAPPPEDRQQRAARQAVNQGGHQTP